MGHFKYWINMVIMHTSWTSQAITQFHSSSMWETSNLTTILLNWRQLCLRKEGMNQARHHTPTFVHVQIIHPQLQLNHASHQMKRQTTYPLNLLTLTCWTWFWRGGIKGHGCAWTNHEEDPADHYFNHSSPHGQKSPTDRNIGVILYLILF